MGASVDTSDSKLQNDDVEPHNENPNNLVIERNGNETFIGDIDVNEGHRDSINSVFNELRTSIDDFTINFERTHPGEAIIVLQDEDDNHGILLTENWYALYTMDFSDRFYRSVRSIKQPPRAVITDYYASLMDQMDHIANLIIRENETNGYTNDD
jgi:hypothetical protein